VCCSVLQSVAVCHSVLHARYCGFVAVCCSVLPCVAVCCSVLQYAAVCCSVLPYVTVCCIVLRCVACSLLHAAWCTANLHRNILNATHCNTLQHSATHCNTLQPAATHCSTLQHTACCKFAARIAQQRRLLGVSMCCSVLQCVAVCCSVLQCVAVCCSVMQVCCSAL